MMDYFTEYIVQRKKNAVDILIIAGIIIAALVYAICLGVTKSFTENDIKMLPKGEKLAKLLAKIKWIG